MPRNVKPLIAIVLLVYFVLHLFSQTLKPERKESGIGKWLVFITSPMQFIVDGSVRWVGDVWNNYIYLVDTAGENNTLKNERDMLKRDLVHLAELESENRRLRNVLGLQMRTELFLLPAKRIASGVSPYERTIRIGKGEGDGVLQGMAIIHPRGVVGQVLRVQKNTSDVLLLSDASSAIDVVNQRSRAQGILRGSRSSYLRFQYLRKGADIQPGDEVVTSGLDGVYPVGIAVGIVSSVDPEPKGLFVDASVTPHVDFNRLEESSVVLGEIR